MREITRQAANHFYNGKRFNLSNTRVTVEGDVVKLLLHGNCIAQRTPLAYTINTCGEPTRLTKERLNGLYGIFICIKKKVWYLNGNAWDGKNIIIGGMV